MFSLIITIVSIALVVALIAATAYYGGDALSQGRNSADAAAYVTSAQQITAAALMRISNGDPAPTALSDLTGDNLLSAVPNVKSRVAGTNDWTFDNGTPRMVTINLAGTAAGNQKLCEQINKNAGATGMDATNGTVASIANYTYGCVPGADSSAPQIFQYKY